MIDRLIEFSIRNRFVVIFFVLLMGAVGVRAAQQLPIDAVPDVTNVQVQVLTNAPGLGPLEVERFITFPVETTMSGIPDLEQVRSVTRFGLSAVTLVFEEGTDYYRARQLVQERLADARAAIPEGYGSPKLGPISTGLGEIYQFEVRGDPMCGPAGGEETSQCYTPMELRSILDWYIAYQLRSVDGVVEVNSFGGELKTYQVEVDPGQLAAYDIALDEVFEALRENNANAGGAYLVHAGEQRLIRGEALLENIDEIEAVVVRTRADGTPVTIAELAEVGLAPMVRQGAVTRDGRGEVVTGIVMMLMGENSREVAQAVDERIDQLRPTLPDGVSIDTYYDRTELVDRTIRTVATNLIEGGVLVIVVLLLLLGNVRGGLLVASVIPLSMLFAFIGMRVFGVSGNLMSLGAIDFGLIVDGAVVMVDNAVRVISKRRARGDEQVTESVRRAALEVGRPVVFAVGIIVLVYVPVLSLRGIAGKMFTPMALTVILALVGSLILALTLMPAASSLVFRGGVAEEETWLMRHARRLYAPLLDAALKRRAATLAAALLLFVGSIGLVPLLGAEFIPQLDEGAIAMQAIRLPSVSLEESVEATGRIERLLNEEFADEVDTVISRTGRAEIATDPMGVEISDIYVMLTAEDEWSAADTKEELVAKMDALLDRELPGQRFSFSQPIELRTNELISGFRNDVAISIYGEDLDELEDLAARVSAVVGRVDGAVDINADQISGLPFLTVDVDRHAIARHGLNADDVLDAVRAMGGHSVGEVFEGQRRFALQVRLRPEARRDPGAIERLLISTPDGRRLPLSELAEVRLEEGPAQLSRENVQRRTTVQLNVRGRDLAGFVEAAKDEIAAEVDMPPGYFIEWGGNFKNLEEATARLAVAVPAALLLIFLLLFMTYGAARPALLIYLNVPMAATGGIIALWVRDMPLSISAGVGFIALFGIAVLNGVVMVSYIRDLQGDGLDLEDASRQGAMSRLRPVLMTALTDAIGFFPMALSTSAGAEVQRPLATVVIGGLVTATLLTMFVLPAVYSWLGGEVEEAS